MFMIAKMVVVLLVRGMCIQPVRTKGRQLESRMDDKVVENASKYELSVTGISNSRSVTQVGTLHQSM